MQQIRKIFPGSSSAGQLTGQRCQAIDDIECKNIDGRSFIVFTASMREEKKDGVKEKALAIAKEAIDMLNAFWVLFWAWLLANLVPFLIVLIAIIILICII